MARVRGVVRKGQCVTAQIATQVISAVRPGVAGRSQFTCRIPRGHARRGMQFAQDEGFREVLRRSRLSCAGMQLSRFSGGGGCGCGLLPGRVSDTRALGEGHLLRHLRLPHRPRVHMRRVGVLSDANRHGSRRMMVTWTLETPELRPVSFPAMTWAANLNVPQRSSQTLTTAYPRWRCILT